VLYPAELRVLRGRLSNRSPVSPPLLCGREFHRLKLAEATAWPLRQAGRLQDRDDVDRAELAQRGFVKKTFLEAEAGAAVGERVAIDFAAVHVEIDCAVAVDLRRADALQADAVDGVSGGRCLRDRVAVARGRGTGNQDQSGDGELMHGGLLFRSWA
jgi:hypothetical protein